MEADYLMSRQAVPTDLSKENAPGSGGVQPGVQSNAPIQEPGGNGPHAADGVRVALDALSQQPARHPETGRFVAGTLVGANTLERSAQFWAAVEDVKQALVARVKADLGLNGDTAETMLGLTDAYAEARLFREAMFIRLTGLGGPVTTKGKRRALYTSYLAAMDRELKLAERLGLERRAKPVVDPLDYVKGKVDL
jgi:hypothetical protein